MNTDIDFLHELHQDVCRAVDRGQTHPNKQRGWSDWLSPGRHRLAYAIAGLGCAALAATGVIIAILAGAHSPTQASSANLGFGRTTTRTGSSNPVPPVLGLAPPAIGRDPFLIGGRRISLAVALARAGYPFPLPDASAANRSRLSAVWIGTAGDVEGALKKSHHEIVLDYVSSQVRVFIKPVQAPTQSFTAARWRRAFLRMIRDDHLRSLTVRTINGHVATVYDKPGTPGDIDMIWIQPHLNLDILIDGRSLATTPADLLAIAHSLTIPTTTTP
jgi:hypothetical protein